MSPHPRYSRLCNEWFPEYRTEAFTGDRTIKEEQEILESYECKEPLTGKRIVDVVIRCGRLGEAYNNPWISIVCFLDTFGSDCPKLHQLIGRALRVPPVHKKLKDKYPKMMEAIMIHPAIAAMSELLEANQKEDVCIDDVLCR